MKKIAAHIVFLAWAISVAPVFAGDADTPPFRLSPTKIPTSSKAYVCQDLPYGGRQVGKGAVHPNVAQTYDLYLPGAIGEIKRSAPFYLFVHGGAWKGGQKGGGRAKLFAEMAEQGFVVASMNYVLCNEKMGGRHTFAEMLADIDAMVAHLPSLANGLTRAGVPFAARLEPYPHCKILGRNPETRPWLYENLRKYLKENAANTCP